VAFAVFQPKREGRAPLALSLVAHVFIIAGFAAITFHVPLEALFGPRVPATQHERVQFMPLRPPPSSGTAGAARSAQPPIKGFPAPLMAPTMIPRGLPPIPQPGSLTGSIMGHGAGTSGAGGITTGVRPLAPDSRLALSTGHYALPRTQAERTDSAVRALFAAYSDSVIAAEANAGRAPGDWTWGKDGDKWGWDPKGIHLGKFTIPNVLLAALPLKTGGVDPQRYRDMKTADYIRNDILLHSGVSEDDFKNEVRRIRERVDQERKDDQQARSAAASGAAGAQDKKVIIVP
jgi:hypothetical protein